MSKPITSDMLQAMSLDQLKTLRKNAQGLATPAAKEVLELIEQSGLIKTAEPALRKRPAAPKAARKPKAKPSPEAKPVRAVHGRQA